MKKPKLLTGELSIKYKAAFSRNLEGADVVLLRLRVTSRAQAGGMPTMATVLYVDGARHGRATLGDNGRRVLELLDKYFHGSKRSHHYTLSVTDVYPDLIDCGGGLYLHKPLSRH